jgi:hypothetical protein
LRKRFLIAGLLAVAAIAYLALRRGPQGSPASPARRAMQSETAAAPRAVEGEARPARPPPPLAETLKDPPPVPAASDLVGWVDHWNDHLPGVMVPGHAGLWSRRDEMLWHLQFYETVSECMESHQVGPKIYRLLLWFQPSPQGWTATSEIENQIQDGNGSSEHTPTLEEVGWFEECANAYLQDHPFDLDDPVAGDTADDRFIWGVYLQIL